MRYDKSKTAGEVGTWQAGCLDAYRYAPEKTRVRSLEARRLTNSDRPLGFVIFGLGRVLYGSSLKGQGQ